MFLEPRLGKSRDVIRRAQFVDSFPVQNAGLHSRPGTRRDVTGSHRHSVYGSRAGQNVLHFRQKPGYREFSRGKWMLPPHEPAITTSVPPDFTIHVSGWLFCLHG
jgi:hypothetical protein